MRVLAVSSQSCTEHGPACQLTMHIDRCTIWMAQQVVSVTMFVFISHRTDLQHALVWRWDQRKRDGHACFGAQRDAICEGKACREGQLTAPSPDSPVPTASWEASAPVGFR